MQPGSHEFQRKTPRTRTSLSVKDISLMLEALGSFHKEHPAHWSKGHEQVEEKLIAALQRLPQRIPVESSHFDNLPLFRALTRQELGDVTKLGE